MPFFLVQLRNAKQVSNGLLVAKGKAGKDNLRNFQLIYLNISSAVN